MGAAAGLTAVAAGWSLGGTPRLPVPEQGRIELLDVTVVNPLVSRRSHQTVVIRDGQIASIADAGLGERADRSAAGRSTPDGPRSVDRFLLPGLIDLHIHLPPWLLPGQLEGFNALLLAHGVTAIREMGSMDGRSLEIRARVREGSLAGPRLFVCGPFLDGDPPVWPVARVVRNAGEGEQAVAALAASGVDCIKVYSRLSSDALDGVARAAEQHRLRVVGHLPAASPWGETRIQEIQHVCDPRCDSLTRRGMNELVEAAARAGLAHTPTLVVFDGQLRAQVFERSIQSPEALLMPRFWREVLWNPAYHLGFERMPTGVRERRIERIHEVFRRLHEGGARLLLGTDPFNPFIVPGASLHREMRLFVELGFGLEEVWAAATREAGEALGTPLLGTLVLGAPADLLIFREDPTRDWAALETLEAVVADGRFYSREVLEQTLAQQRRHFSGRLYDAVSMTGARLAAFAFSAFDD